MTRTTPQPALVSCETGPTGGPEHDLERTSVPTVILEFRFSHTNHVVFKRRE